jgi:hypothetical protein
LPRGSKLGYAYGLSSCCIVAPLLLAFVALDRTASMLTHRATGLELRYEFLSATDLPRAASVAEAKQIAEKNEQDLAVTFLAKDLRGRASYAVASALLYFASAAAIGFGLGVVGLSTAETKCAKWRRDIVPVGLRERGFEAPVYDCVFVST